MMKSMLPTKARGLAALSLTTFTLAACSTMTGTLFPEKPPSPVATSGTVNLPQSGTSFFTPVPVVPAASSGTPHGERIAELRNRLIAIQGEISARNASLSDIRQRLAGDGALYRIAKSELVAAPAAAPVAQTKAQAALDRINANTTALDGEMRVFAKGAAEAAKLMNESAAIRDANETDQGQLNTLRGEIGATANQLDRLVNEISTEWALQSAFLAKERAGLATLTGGASTTTVAGTVATLASASPALLAQPAFVTIKFDRANVSYRDALAQAVSAARRRNPATAFDIVGITAGRSVSPEATARAQEVANTLSTLGVEPAKIRLLTAINSTAQANEVRIYAR
jgi:predicted small secreted protein